MIEKIEGYMGKVPEIVDRTVSPFKNVQKKDESGEWFESGFEIYVIEGEDRGKTFPLNRREYMLGRLGSPADEKTGQILFADKTVSRAHASLIWDDELERYVIHHQSRTNATLVNGRAVKKALLNAEHVVQMGKLIFKLISVQDETERESQKMWEQFRIGEIRGDERINTGYHLAVIEGPDKGKIFRLDKNLMVLGRRTGPGDIRDTCGVLLDDPKLPDELALLVWNEHEGKYAIFQSEESRAPIQLFREVESLEGSRIVGKELKNLLENQDQIAAGQTVILVQASRTPEKQEPPAPEPTTAPAKEEKALELVPSVEGVRRAEFSRPFLEIPREDESEKEPGGMTSLGKFQIDFVFEIVEGKDAGEKISLLSSEMTESRKLYIGKKGKRMNEIELNDKSLDNLQGHVEYKKGRLYLVNEKTGIEFSINGAPCPENEKMLLSAGDTIKIGDSLLRFIDHRLAHILGKYALMVADGVEKDKGKRFPFIQSSFNIGRGSNCEVRLFDPEVSRLHATLFFSEGRFLLKHRSKVNPTFVNGVSLGMGKERILFPGDKIHLSAATILQFIKI